MSKSSTDGNLINQPVTPGAVAPNVSYQAPRWSEPAQYDRRFYMAVAGIIVFALASFVYVLPYLAVRGIGTTILVVFLALLPVIVIFSFIRWVDQWEPEPGWLYGVAFVWGCGVAALTALIGNEIFSEAVSLTIHLNEFGQDVLPVVVGAPLIEEATKGIGILVIFFVFRKYFNGPVDGLVYGMIIGVGFAFSENILYFSEYYDEIGAVFQARAIENPFVHPLATGITGLSIGAAANATHRRVVVPYAILGYFGAVLLHALHNFSSVTSMSSGTRFAFQLPIYGVMLWIIWYIRGKEQFNVSKCLVDYVEAGWLTRNELTMISKVSLRRNAVVWAGNNASALGLAEADGRRAMERFQEEVVGLGYDRYRQLRQGTVNAPANRREEMRKLQLIAYLREVFTGKNAYSG